MERSIHDPVLRRERRPLDATLVVDDAAEILLGLHLVVAGGDDDQVHPGGADLLFDCGLGSRSERDHRQYRSHPDSHAEHGQRGLQLVALERLDRDREAGCEGH